MIENSEQRRYFLLSEFAYVQIFDKPEDAVPYEGKTFGELVEIYKYKTIPVNGGLGNEEFHDIMEEIEQDDQLKNLVFTGYANNNEPENNDGFVAYSFRDGVRKNANCAKQK